MLATWFLESEVADRGVISFVDNESACSALIRGSATQSDVMLIAQMTQLQWMKSSTRTWVEWIDSDSNCSDGLSRDGLKDVWTLAQHWLLSEVSLSAQFSDPRRLLELMRTTLT